MKIPSDVLFCLERLENAGFQCYLVGGCVRDSLLGLIPQDYDLCTNALPEETEEVFSDCRLILAGKKHGTVAVLTPSGPVEITTYRTEGDYLDNRHPQWVSFVPDIHQDLARRDFTVNAMAYSPTRGFADPFGGRRDLSEGVLRCVGDPPSRFREDALRILRGVRFSVKYRLAPHPDTLRAMEGLSSLLDHLARERVFDELCKLLPLVTAEDILNFRPIFTSLIPQLSPTVGFDQRNPHHAYDLFTHIAHVTSAVPADPVLRMAALLHDIGKISTFTLDESSCGHFYGHAQASAQMADEILLSLRAPTLFRQQVVQLIDLHMTCPEPTKKNIRRWLGKLGEPTLRKLLALQKADTISKGTTNDSSHFFETIEILLSQVLSEDACLTLKDLAVNGSDLMALGIPPSKELGLLLGKLLDLVQAESLPNEKSALLEYVRQTIQSSSSVH